MRVVGDDVKLALVAPPVSVEHLPSDTDQMLYGVFLPDPADRPGLSTNNHKITSCPTLWAGNRVRRTIPQALFPGADEEVV